jgi:hypothetical protein
MLVTGALVAVGGLLSAAGIENPQRDVPCAEHAPGATVGPTVAREGA